MPTGPQPARPTSASKGFRSASEQIANVEYMLTGDGRLRVGTRPLVYRADPKMVFDHCHAHLWIRGLVCDSCNRVMATIDKHFVMPAHAVGYDRRDAYVSYRNRCPDCVPVRTLLTDNEIFAITENPSRKSYSSIFGEFRRWELAQLAASYGMSYEQLRYYTYEQYAEHIAGKAIRYGYSGDGKLIYPPLTLATYDALPEPTFDQVNVIFERRAKSKCDHVYHPFEACPRDCSCRCKICRPVSGDWY